MKSPQGHYGDVICSNFAFVKEDFSAKLQQKTQYFLDSYCVNIFKTPNYVACCSSIRTFMCWPIQKWAVIGKP